MSARNTSTFGQLKNISETTQGVITDEDILAVQIGSGELVNVTHQQFFDFIGGAIDQTPWVTDIDAADNSLLNLENLTFTADDESTPADNIPYITYVDGAPTDAMLFNVPIGEGFRFFENGVEIFTLGIPFMDVHHGLIQNIGGLDLTPGNPETSFPRINFKTDPQAPTDGVGEIVFRNITGTKIYYVLDVGIATLSPDSAEVRTDMIIGGNLQQIAHVVGGTTVDTSLNTIFIKTKFTPSSIVAGLNVGEHGGNPSAPVRGDILYHELNNKFIAYENGIWKNMINEDILFQEDTNVTVIDNGSNGKVAITIDGAGTPQYEFTSIQFTSNGDVKINKTAPTLTFESTDINPGLEDNLVGEIMFIGNNDAAELTDYGRIFTKIISPADGAESGEMEFKLKNGGVEKVFLNLNKTGNNIIQINANLDANVKQLINVGSVNFAIIDNIPPVGTTPYILYDEDVTDAPGMHFNIPGTLQRFEFFTNGVSVLDFNHQTVNFRNQFLHDISSLELRKTINQADLSFQKIDPTGGNVVIGTITGHTTNPDDSYTSILLDATVLGPTTPQGKIVFGVAMGGEVMDILTLFGGSTPSLSIVGFNAKANMLATADHAGLNVGSHSSDPSTGVNGDIYYNSNTNKFKAFENGAWVNMI